MSRGNSNKTKTAPKTSAPRGKQANGSKTTSKRSASSASKRQNKQTKPAAATPATGKKARKNVSQTIPNGRTLQTRDEYLEGAENYKKPGKEGAGNYRKLAIVDSNRKGELAVTKLTTSKKGTPLPNYKEGKSKYRPYIETKDDEGNPIKIGRKFIENSPSKDLSTHDVNLIKKHAIKETSRSLSKENRKKLRELKGRK